MEKCNVTNWKKGKKELELNKNINITLSYMLVIFDNAEEIA